MRLSIPYAAASILGLGLGIGGAYAVASLTETNQTVIINSWRITWPFNDRAENPLAQAAISQSLVKNGAPLDYGLFIARQDADGVPLTGSAHYILHFAKDDFPPVDGFWSVMIVSPTGAAIQNPIFRSVLGNQTPGIAYGGDGSLDIFIQNSPPIQGIANWLPAPTTEFMLILRAYGPNGAILKHIWAPPPIRTIMSAA